MEKLLSTNEISCASLTIYRQLYWFYIFSFSESAVSWGPANRPSHHNMSISLRNLYRVLRKFAQLNSYAVRVFGTSSKMFAIFVMSCLGPKECHRSSVGENETRDQKIFYCRNQYPILGKYGRPSIYNASQSTVFIAKMTCKGVITHQVLKFT